MFPPVSGSVPSSRHFVTTGSLALDRDRDSACPGGRSSQEAVPPRCGAGQRPLEGGRVVEEGLLVRGHDYIQVRMSHLFVFFSILILRALITMDRLLTSATGRRGALDDEEYVHYPVSSLVRAS